MQARLVIVSVVLAMSRVSAAAPGAPVTVFLDRGGAVLDDGTAIPAFGGGDRVWTAVVACVKQHYAPFRVDLVDRRPARGTYITALVGGLASQLDLDDATTNGVGPYTGEVIPDALVHIFSQVGDGEHEVENLCAVAAHEVGHALGLDHEVYCGDIMSYYADQCGARRFVDVEAPCGEDSERACGNGEQTQNSFRRLVTMVGLRDGQPPAPRPEPVEDGPADDDAAQTAQAQDDDAVHDGDEQVVVRHRHHGRRHSHRGDRGDRSYR